jgi:hypothetical protein
MQALFWSMAVNRYFDLCPQVVLVAMANIVFNQQVELFDGLTFQNPQHIYPMLVLQLSVLHGLLAVGFNRQPTPCICIPG